MFSLLLAWPTCWRNNWVACDFRFHNTHVTLLQWCYFVLFITFHRHGSIKVIFLVVMKDILMNYWGTKALMGILQNMVNPSLAPTQPEGSELPTFSYGGEGIPRALKQYRFSPHAYIFQYGEVINSINPRDSYLHHWPGSPLTQVMA